MHSLKGLKGACMVLEATAFAVDPACILGSACILPVEKTACIPLVADTAHIPHAEDTACRLLVAESFACKLDEGNMAALLLFGHNFQASRLVVLLSLPSQTF